MVVSHSSNEDGHTKHLHLFIILGNQNAKYYVYNAPLAVLVRIDTPPGFRDGNRTQTKRYSGR